MNKPDGTELFERMDAVKGIDLARLRELAEAEREGRAVVLPCKVGDTVWVLRNYSGVIMPMSGIVEEMNFTRWSNPNIVVHGIGRGRWGEKIFATASEARRALAEKGEADDHK